MLPWDAARLGAYVTDQRGATGYAVIDVTVSSGRLPPTRWVLSNTQIWFITTPVLMGFLTSSMLRPSMIYERIMVLDHDCVSDPVRRARQNPRS